MAEPRGARSQTDAVDQHRRETWTQIALPVAVGGALVIVGLAVAMLLPRVRQVSAVSDFLVTVLLLCPLAVCLLPAALGLLVLALGMNLVHERATGLLGRVVTLSETISKRVESGADGIAHRAIDVSAKLAPVEQRVFGAFDRPEPSSPKEAKNVPNPRE